MPQRVRASIFTQASIYLALLLCLSLFNLGFVHMAARRETRNEATVAAAAQLRESIYRLSWKMQTDTAPAELQRLQNRLIGSLYSPALTLRATTAKNRALQAHHEELTRLWQQELKPALDSGDEARFLGNADRFAAIAGQLRNALTDAGRHQHERNLLVLWLSLTATIGLLLFALYRLRVRVLFPLQQLARANLQLRAGRLGTRVHYRAGDEVGRLVSSFNAMTEAVAASQRMLESDVEDKVRDLSRANATLALLFECSRRVASVPPDADFLDDLIRRFQEQLPGFQLTLCLFATDEDDFRRFVCPSDDDKPAPSVPAAHSYAVRSQGQVLGMLRVRVLSDREALPWQAELLQALADLIGTSLMLRRQREQDNQLLLLDERNTIARELHDSLAQSLSYLKLQVGCTQTLLQRGSPAPQMETAFEELRGGVNDAYRQLRDLLATFRLQVKTGNVIQTVQEAITDISTRAGLRIWLRTNMPAVPLSADEHRHLLHILREALTNCARHAGASQVRVYLFQNDDGVELRVEDDGSGVRLDYDRSQHFGISMMEERAFCIAGSLRIEPITPRGTRVRLQFLPVAWRQPARPLAE